MDIECELEETIIEHKGKDVNGLVLTCAECDHCVSRPGRDTAENRRMLVEEMEHACPERIRMRHRILPQ